MQDRIPEDEKLIIGEIYKNWRGLHFRVVSQFWEYGLTGTNVINIEYPSYRETSEVYTTTLGKTDDYERVL